MTDRTQGGGGARSATPRAVIERPSPPEQPFEQQLPSPLAVALAGSSPRRTIEVLFAVTVVAVYLLGPTRSPAGEARLARATTNADRVVELERSVGVLVEPTIQTAALSVPGLVALANVAYGSLHFLVTPAVLVWLFRCRRRRYTLWRNTLAVASLLAFVVYQWWPLAPPRMAGGPDGGPLLLDTLASHPSLWSFDSPVIQRAADPLAAMPSMHVGWALVCAWAVASNVRQPWARRAAWAYPVAIAAVIVITGNHYLADAAGGVLVVLVAHLAARLVARLASDPTSATDGTVEEPGVDQLC